MKNFLRKCVLLLARLYWKVFHPRTFGVKAVIIRAEYPQSVLLVLHAYGDQTLWNLPGGGFNPRKETATEAIVRELQEELQCKFEPVEVIGEYYTDSEGKRDTVTIFLVRVHGDVQIPRNGEIGMTQWLDIKKAGSMPSVARVAREGARLYRIRFSGQ